MSKLETAEEAREVCLRLLARRDHCRNELLEKLKSRGCEARTAERVVEQLASEGLQSERRFLESFVRGRVAKGYGEARIRQELRYLGLDREDVDGSLRAYDWGEVLAGVYRKKYGLTPPASAREQAACFRFLQQRGFASSAIIGLLGHLRRDEN